MAHHFYFCFLETCCTAPKINYPGLVREKIGKHCRGWGPKAWDNTKFVLGSFGKMLCCPHFTGAKLAKKRWTLPIFGGLVRQQASQVPKDSFPNRFGTVQYFCCAGFSFGQDSTLASSRKHFVASQGFRDWRHKVLG